jgi:hypothetical protein
MKLAPGAPLAVNLSFDEAAAPLPTARVAMDRVAGLLVKARLLQNVGRQSISHIVRAMRQQALIAAVGKV